MIQFSPKKVILVTGANGQLGQELRYLAGKQDQFEFVFASRENMDVGNKEEVDHVFSKFRPDVCINCAAYTKVDAAEENAEEAFRINRDGIANLIIACTSYPALLIHFSTDYVYHSVTDRPIQESDLCAPKGVYAQSKRAGELLLAESSIDWICFRVSWLYSSFGHNFVKTMVRLSQEIPVINVVEDQIGSPTYARDLAEVLIELMGTADKSSYNQFYNYSNTGTTNWADYARKIIQFKGIDSTVCGITTQQFGAAAPRPAWSVLDHSKFYKTFNLQIPGWEESLLNCLELL